jgi:hypothetical protein
MSKQFKTSNNYFVITDTKTGVEELRNAKNNIYYKIAGKNVHFYEKSTGKTESVNIYNKDNVVNGNNEDSTFTTLAELQIFLDKNTGSEAPLDVVLQDSEAPLMIVEASKLITETTVAIITAKNDYIVNVADATSFATGQYLTIYNEVANRVFFAKVILVDVLAITINVPLDFEFAVGSFVSIGDLNMNLDGSSTPQIFGIRNPTGVDIPLAYDITRIIFTCECNSSLDLSKFGDIAGGIARGLIVRKVDGTYRNVFHFKTNRELKSKCFDFDIETAIGNAKDGFSARITFAGQNKMGAVIRLKEDEDLQFLVQDPLETLHFLGATVEGSEVID